MHPLMNDCDNADVTVRQPAPIDEMTFIAEEVAFDAELGWNGAR